jgi:polysaccharide export outer membrane protein
MVFSHAAASADEPVSNEAYTLGPGDRILISVLEEPGLSMTLQLNEAGILNYPFLGELKLAGLTVRELEMLITAGLKGPYLVDPEVTVTIKEYRPFYIYGEVNDPGGIPYRPGLTLHGAIALGGGFTERAAKLETTVIRSTDPAKQERLIGLNDTVRPGDVINVPQSFF